MVEFSGGGVSLTNIGRKTMVFVIIYTVISSIMTAVLMQMGYDVPSVFSTRFEQDIVDKMQESITGGGTSIFWGAFLVSVTLTFIGLLKNVLVGIVLLAWNFAEYFSSNGGGPLVFAFVGTIATFLQISVLMYAIAWLRGIVKE